MKFYCKLLLLLMVVLASCKQGTSVESIATETISFTKEGALHLFKNDSVIATLEVEFAETDYETQTGLMYRSSMNDNESMLFIFPDEAMHSFYMKNTEFSLDIIFIDGQGRIASFQKGAQPFDQTGLSSKVPVKYVLEINAGLADKWNLAVGDSISFTRLH